MYLCGYSCSACTSKHVFSFVFRELPFYILSIYLLKINFLSFPSSENVFISFSFLKDIFIGYRVLGWQFFSFGTENILYHFLLSSVVCSEKSAIIRIVVFSYKHDDTSLSLLFKILFSFLVSRVWLWCVLVCIYLKSEF